MGERDFRQDVESGVVLRADDLLGLLGSDNAADCGGGGAGNDGESRRGAGEAVNGNNGGE